MKAARQLWILKFMAARVARVDSGTHLSRTELDIPEHLSVQRVTEYCYSVPAWRWRDPAAAPLFSWRVLSIV